MKQSTTRPHTMITITGALTLLLIAFSLLLTFWISEANLNWPLLSNVGQSFGLAATAFSGAALIGVVITVNLQRRQEMIMSEQAIRNLHLEIMRDAWGSPELLRSLEVVPAGQDDLAKRVAFLNIYFMYLRLGLNSRQVTLGEVEDLAAHSFSTSAGSFYWRRASLHVRRHFEPQFVDALDRAYERSLVRPEGIFINDEDLGKR